MKNRSDPFGILSPLPNLFPKATDLNFKQQTSKNQVLLSGLQKPNNGFALGYFMSVMWVHLKGEYK